MNPGSRSSVFSGKHSDKPTVRYVTHTLWQTDKELESSWCEVNTSGGLKYDPKEMLILLCIGGANMQLFANMFTVSTWW